MQITRKPPSHCTWPLGRPWPLGGNSPEPCRLSPTHLLSPPVMLVPEISQFEFHFLFLNRGFVLLVKSSALKYPKKPGSSVTLSKPSLKAGIDIRKREEMPTRNAKTKGKYQEVKTNLSFYTFSLLRFQHWAPSHRPTINRYKISYVYTWYTQSGAGLAD